MAGPVASRVAQHCIGLYGIVYVCTVPTLGRVESSSATQLYLSTLDGVQDDNFPSVGPITTRPGQLYNFVQACTTLYNIANFSHLIHPEIKAPSFLPNRREVKFSLQLNFTLDHGGICRFLGLTAYHSDLFWHSRSHCRSRDRFRMETIERFFLRHQGSLFFFLPLATIKFPLG